MYAMGEYILETIRGHSGMEAARIYSMYTLVLNMVFLTFLENKINAPSWSAGVDFYLYILFVLIVIVFRKRTIRVLTYSLLIVATYVYMYLFCTNMSLWVSGSQAYVRGVAGFFGGVLGYQLYKNYMEGNDKSINSTRIVKVVSWTLLFVIISVLSFKQPGGSDFYMLPIFALFIVSLTVDVDGLISKYLQSKFLQLLGAISYSLYMSHLLISRIISLPAYKGYLSGIVPQDSLIVTEYNASLSFAFTMVYIIASLLFAHRLYHLVEAPCRSRSRELADQWFGREACIPTNTATDSE